MVDNNKSKLDKEILLKLMAEADAKWYNGHSDHHNDYRKHLEFTVDHIAKNYNKRRRARQSDRREVKLL